MSESTKESSAEDVPQSATPPTPKPPRRRKWLRRCGEQEARIWMCEPTQPASRAGLRVEFELGL
jgi:hypothetical protein